MKVNRGLSLDDRRLYYSTATVTDRYTPGLISGHASDTLWIHQISEDIRHPGRQCEWGIKVLVMRFESNTLRSCIDYNFIFEWDVKIILSN